MLTRMLLLMAATTCVCLATAQEPKPDPVKGKIRSEVLANPKERAQAAEGPFAIAALLQERVNDPKLHAQITLKEYLQLAKQSGWLPTVICVERTIGQADQEESMLSRQINMPIVDGMRGETALKLLCAQIRMGYIIERDHIALIPLPLWLGRLGIDKILAEQQGESGEVTIDALAADYPVVTIDLSGLSLHEAASKLSERANVTIIVADEKLGQRKLPASMKLINAPLDSAIKAMAHSLQASSSRDSNILSIFPKEAATP